MNRFELADAMLRGLNTQGVKESRDRYIAVARNNQLCRACALGLALIGINGGDYHKAEAVYDQRCLERCSYDSTQVIFADLLDIAPELAIEIEHKHLNGMSVEQIAAWLKSSEDQEVKFNV